VDVTIEAIDFSTLSTKAIKPANKAPPPVKAAGGGGGRGRGR
jgi:hypothetical protein